MSYLSPTQTNKAAIVAGLALTSGTLLIGTFGYGLSLQDKIFSVTFLPTEAAYYAYFLFEGFLILLLFASLLFGSVAWPWYRRGAFKLRVSNHGIIISAGKVTMPLDYVNIAKATLVHGLIDAREWSPMSSRFAGTGLMLTLAPNGKGQRQDLVIPLTHKTELPADVKAQLFRVLTVFGVKCGTQLTG
jgi:hypothetical protein